MFLLPSLNRPNSLRRFFDAYRKTKAIAPGRILVDKDDFQANRDAYTALELPTNWLFSLTEGRTQGDKFRETWEQYKDYEWVGLLGDDCVPETEHWDKYLIDELKGWNFVSPNDGWQAPKRIGNCAVFSGELVRAVGYLVPLELNHLYIDDVWEQIGKATGCWFVDMETTVRHAHATLTGEIDDTHKVQELFWKLDPDIYNDWVYARTYESLSKATSAVKELISRKLTPDKQLLTKSLEGCSVLIATPAGDRSYEGCYVKSFVNTALMLKELGAKVEWAEMPYCADLPLARAKLLGTFYRDTRMTHLMMIDDDMGWNPMDVVRLLLLKRDFVAAAGRKKIENEEYCCNSSTDDNTPIPVRYEGGSGLAEYTDVGLAFALVTRACVERMFQSYPDLIFKDPKGFDEYALFDPFILHGWRRSEDYAFCYRWRNIGGKIYLLADVILEHVGKKTWSGALASAMSALQIKEAAE